MLGLALAASASAETYWLDYEGDAFPESCGWTRIWNQPFAQRAIEDGVFVLDASADRHTCDWYEHYTDNGCAWPMADVEVPDPRSYFFMQWRVKIENFVGQALGVSVGVFAPDSWALGFEINDDTVRSAFESGVSAPLEGGVFHEFEVRSSDMRAYQLYIDGSLGFEGHFYDAVRSNLITWGEGTTGASSLSSWDYLRVGVAPEPGVLASMLALAACCAVFRRGALREFGADSIRGQRLTKRGHAYGVTL